MSKVTMQTAAIRGKLTIEQSDITSDQFRCSGGNYEPFTFTADTLGSAVDTVMSNLHKLKKSAVSEAKSNARSERMRKLWRDKADKLHAAEHSATKTSTKTVPTIGSKSA